MTFRVLISLICVLFAIPTSAEIRSFSELARKMAETERSRTEGVTDYAMDISLMGHQTTQFFERASVKAPDGRSVETFRLVPFDELQKRRGGAPGTTPEGMQAYGDALRTTGEALGSELDRGMAQAGLPSGLLGALGAGSADEPWASPDPRVMMSTMAVFADAAATAEPSPDGTANVAESLDAMAAFARRAEIVGRERVDGRQAYHAKADGLELTQEVDDGTFLIRSMSLWVDAEKFVPLKMRMDGIATQGGDSREIFLERFDTDYRTVPGSLLYLPYKNVVRMGGVLSSDEQEQMKDARKQLAEFDKQLAAMPPDQKAMVEKMMGTRMEAMRKMVGGGAMELETVVQEIRVNEGRSR